MFFFYYCRKYDRSITVHTIDGVQGQEKDVIILSTVRTNGIGFLSDYQRMNVALTRAKRALYILGNFTSLQVSLVTKVDYFGIISVLMFPKNEATSLTLSRTYITTPETCYFPFSFIASK